MYLTKYHNALAYNEEMCDEMYNVEVLINATKCCCQEREFRGEYYGIPERFIQKISNERNEYLSLLAILSDKVRHVIKLNQCVEQELTLHQYSDNCSRHITT